MKLSNVLISNLASFPYIADLQHSSWVNFTVENNWTIHIFIGPNGAGKSMFLDIIQQVCTTVFFQPFACDTKDIDSIHNIVDKKIIHHKHYPIHNIHENKTWIWKASHVSIVFALNDQDRANLKFVFAHQREFNELIKTYSTSTYAFDFTWIDTLLDSYELIKCQVQVDTHTHQAWVIDTDAQPVEKFMYAFFTYFHLLQHCIAIHNMLNPWAEDHWHALHATFATVWSYRNLLHYKDSYTIWSEENDRFLFTLQDASVSSVKTSQDHLIWLLYVKKKISFLIYEKNPHATYEEIQEIIKDYDIYKNLNAFCKRYLRRTLIVKPDDKIPYTYTFTLQDADWNVYYLDDLSAGEKSILWIVCAVYWFGLDQWLLVIDEPELHLHPQLQKQFLKLIEDISIQYGLQCIMTTHSSLMINDANIRHVYRFYTDRWITRIITPGEHYTEDASKLMQILKFTNTAKIFFVKKIIMVEWETDEFAFGNYLQHLANHDEQWRSVIRDYEIVNINGKWWYARWKKFLNSFGIDSYFIGDRDNIQDTWNQAIDMNYYANRMRRVRGYGWGWYQTKSDKYKNIIKYLKTHEPKHWDEIEATIKWLYRKHIFVLQQWDIEAYLWMHEKGLEETVQFFQNDFTNWLHDRSFDQERNELNNIFAAIFNKQS